MDINSESFIRTASLRILCSMIGKNDIDADHHELAVSSVDRAFELYQILEDRFSDIRELEQE